MRIRKTLAIVLFAVAALIGGAASQILQEASAFAQQAADPAGAIRGKAFTFVDERGAAVATLRVVTAPRRGSEPQLELVDRGGKVLWSTGPKIMPLN